MQGNSLHLDNTVIWSRTAGGNDHPGVACQIDVAGEFLMTNASRIETNNYQGGAGGDIRIEAGTVPAG